MKRTKARSNVYTQYSINIGLYTAHQRYSSAVRRTLSVPARYSPGSSIIHRDHSCAMRWGLGVRRRIVWLVRIEDRHLSHREFIVVSGCVCAYIWPDTSDPSEEDSEAIHLV